MNSSLSHTQKLSIFQESPLYFVTCEERSLGRSDEEVVAAVLKAGIKLIQYRDKTASPEVKLRKARRIKELVGEAGGILIVNDDIRLALEVKADGVHLGQNDLSVEEARALVEKRDGGKTGENFLIGQSTHNRKEIGKAQELLFQGRPAIDYINIGPIFPTNTKVNEYPPIGDGIFELVKFIKIPFSMMGGIKEKHFVPFRMKFPQTPLAMITEISESPDIEDKIQSLLQYQREKEIIF